MPLSKVNDLGLKSDHRAVRWSSCAILLKSIFRGRARARGLSAASPRLLTAMEALMLVADLGGPTMFARIKRWRSLGESNPCFSLERGDLANSHRARGKSCPHCLQDQSIERLALPIGRRQPNGIRSSKCLLTTPLSNLVTQSPASLKASNVVPRCWSRPSRSPELALRQLVQHIGGLVHPATVRVALPSAISSRKIRNLRS